MKFKHLGMTLALLTGLASGANASTVTIDALQMIRSYNVIALGDFEMKGSHVEGTAYIGGNLKLNGATDFNGDGQVPAVTGLTGDLIVGGNISSGTINFVKTAGGGAGKVVVGGTNAATINQGTVTTGATIPTAAVTASMLSMSAFLATLETTAGAGFAPKPGDASKKELVLGSGNADKFVVVNISASDAGAFLASEINNLNTSAFKGVFINIAGTGSFDRTGNWNAQSNNVILNFFEATGVKNSNGNLNYSVLAPLADVMTAGSGVNGFVVGKTITNFAEIRPPFTNQAQNYGGELPVPSVPAVPLPAAGWLMLAALGGLFGLRRRAA